MHNTRSNLNQLAASVGTSETAINTEQTLDQSLLVGADDYLQVVPRRENNADEANGKEEPDLVYDNGQTVNMSANFSKLQPNHAAFMLAYGLGSTATVAAGTGYEHTITPISGDVDNDRSNPTFTAGQRLGETINKTLAASMGVSSTSITFAADDWVTGSAELVGTGKVEHTATEELDINALDNVTSLTLASVGVQGATDTERLDNVFTVRAYYNGAWRYLTPTAVSAATPAVITIPSLGGSGASVEYRVLRVATEPAWATFPARVVETPLRVSQMYLTIGGEWDGSAFQGGRQICSRLSSFSWDFSNEGMEPVFTPCAGGSYAGRMQRESRNQTLSIAQELKDVLAREIMTANEYFGLHVICEGAEYSAGHKYTLEVIFPRLGILNNPLSSDRSRVAETLDIQVLEDAIYGSVIVKVKNLVSGYAS